MNRWWWRIKWRVQRRFYLLARAFYKLRNRFTWPHEPVTVESQESCRAANARMHERQMRAYSEVQHQQSKMAAVAGLPVNMMFGKMPDHTERNLLAAAKNLRDKLGTYDLGWFQDLDEGDPLRAAMVLFEAAITEAERREQVKRDIADQRPDWSAA